MKTIFLLLISFCSYGQALSVISGSRGPGGADNTAPALTITTTAIDPVVGTTGVTTISATIIGSKTLVGLVIGDITTTNCTVLNFVTNSGSNYTVDVKPSSNGAFSIQVGANKCTDTRGNNNTASNTLSLTFADASGYTYDLQNAANISKSQHYRGHVASFSDCTDLGSSLSYMGGEMMSCKYNIGATVFANGTNQQNKDVYSFGRLDFGDWLLLDNYATVDPYNTTNRNGVQTTVMSYKNGNTSVSSSFLTRLLYGRNSNYEAVGQTLPITYATGLTDVNLISRGVTFRWDYYAQTTNGDYYAGTLATGRTKLANYVSQVVSNNGWYSNFTHWHWWYENYPKKYYDTLAVLTAPYDIYFGTANSVAEYYWVKEAVDNVTGSGSLVTVNYSKKYPSSPYSKITTPAWIKVDLTGTGYAGYDITTSHGGRIRNMGSNVYYISVPLDFSTTSVSFNIYVTPTPNYINLTAPSMSRSGNTITSTDGQPVKISLYYKAKTSPYEIDVILLERNLTFNTSFTLSSTLNTTLNDYYLAAINAEGISSVLQF